MKSGVNYHSSSGRSRGQSPLFQPDQYTLEIRLKGQMKRKALITGITGQDGSYLAELLLEKDYAVYGIVRRAALEDPAHRMWRVRNILDQQDLHIEAASLESYASLFKVIKRVLPDEVYHLAAQSYVQESFDDPFSTMRINVQGTLYMLEAIRELSLQARFYFAGSSEMFGKVRETPQRETTPFHPRSPYGISKVAGFDLTRNYREGHNLHASSGILFNHESPRRGHEFVTRKITKAVALIKAGLENRLTLGNLEAKRDWGHSKDYVKAMWLMLQQENPDDYVIATGETHTVREFCAEAFNYAGLNYQDYVESASSLYRPAEVDLLQGDSSKARKKLEWTPVYDFKELVSEMVKHDFSEVMPDSDKNDTQSSVN